MALGKIEKATTKLASLDSLRRARRSECPRMTHFSPRSARMSALQQIWYQGNPIFRAACIYIQRGDFKRKYEYILIDSWFLSQRQVWAWFQAAMPLLGCKASAIMQSRLISKFCTPAWMASRFVVVVCWIRSNMQNFSENGYLISPVYAPEPLTQQFCAATLIGAFKLAFTAGICTYVGAITTSAALARLTIDKAKSQSLTDIQSLRPGFLKAASGHGQADDSPTSLLIVASFKPLTSSSVLLTVPFWRKPYFRLPEFSERTRFPERRHLLGTKKEMTTTRPVVCMALSSNSKDTSWKLEGLQ